MDKIDKLIESEGERFIGFWDDRWFIFFEPKRLDYKIAEASDFLFDDEVICTVGEYKKRLKQKNGDEPFEGKIIKDKWLRNPNEQQLLETYTGLAMQALIARGESKSGVKSLSREFAQSAIDSLNGVCDENTTE